jgi:hypothetical protein
LLISAHATSASSPLIWTCSTSNPQARAGNRLGNVEI